jgi:alcohol dehydrogenase class IV
MFQGHRMPMSPHPTSFGVFKPVDHVLMSFEAAEQAEEAAQALLTAGFAPEAVSRYTPAQMQAQAESDMASASTLAAIGQELNLVKAHHALALQGQSFLVVHAPHDEQLAQATEVALRFGATRAQRYGSLLIEELVPVGSSAVQVAESSDRGLDAQTRSGVEGT